MKKNKAGTWSGKSRGGSFGHRFFIGLVRRGGLRTAYAFLALVVIYFIPCAPKATRAIWFYNRNILGYGRLKAARKLVSHYYRFGQTLIDKIAFSAGLQHKFSFGFTNYENFLSVLDGGSGVILVSAHTGNWEAGSLFFGDYGRKINVVLYDAEYRQIREAMASLDNPTSFSVIPAGEGLESVVRITSLLDRGEYVCFQGDRFLNPETTVEQTFMGRPARFPQGPFRLASKLKVPVVFYYAMREKGRRYHFYFMPQEMGISQQTLLERYRYATEEVVRAYPQQWFNFYRFWS